MPADTPTAMRNLELANEIRFRRAAIRRQLQARELPLLAAITDPAMRNARIFDVLCWLPGWGRTRTLRLLGHHQISPARLCGDLTLRQRHLLTLDECEDDEPTTIAAAGAREQLRFGDGS